MTPPAVLKADEWLELENRDRSVLPTDEAGLWFTFRPAQRREVGQALWAYARR